jgi:PAS domain S-box-containing protein
MSDAKPSVAVAVNDDPTQLRLISAVIEKAGITVFPCESVDVALEVMASRGRPDLIVTDLNMPGIDGWSFCRLLRSPEYASLNDVPILVVSATYAGADAAQMTLDLGANAFLGAPFEAAVLRGHVRDLLAGETPRRVPNVLLVEDDPALADTLEQAFRTHNYHVVCANTGQAAREAFRRRQPDMLILDYHLPDTTGEALLAEFKPAGSWTTAVMITSEPTPELATRLMKMGADAYVRKPFDPEYLIRLCEKACRERTFLHVENLLDARTRALRDSELLYRKTIDAMEDAIYVVDRDLRVTLFNATFGRWCEELGLPTSPLHRPLPEVVSGFSDEDREEYRRVFETGRTHVAEERLTIGERTLLAETRKIPVKEGPTVTRVVTVIRDIVERKRLDEQIRQTQKLEAIGQLAGGVAHDFNNILAAIQGSAELLKMTLPRGAEQSEYADSIVRAADKMATRTRQLLAFARKGQFRIAPVNVHTLIGEVVDELTAGMDKPIAIDLDFRAEPPHLRGDRVHLCGALLSLAQNARDAMADGGTLSFTTRNVTFDAEGGTEHVYEVAPGAYIEICVCDTGVGMDPDTQSHVFEPFFTTKEIGQGTGLNMAGVYGCRKSHDGDIQVHSEPGRGTTFRVLLPQVGG